MFLQKKFIVYMVIYDLQRVPSIVADIHPQPATPFIRNTFFAVDRHCAGTSGTIESGSKVVIVKEHDWQDGTD